MEGRDLQGIQAKLKDMYLSALIANWQVWPAAQLINFRYMPLQCVVQPWVRLLSNDSARYRVPFQATLGVFWSLYLSLLNAR